jgi:chromosome segregation ATPase
MSQEREALRAEVEQLRKSLENLQGKHSEEIFAIKNQHEEQLLRAHERHAEDISSAKKEQAEELATVKAELEESQSAKDQAETQYQHLLGRINTIKSSLRQISKNCQKLRNRLKNLRHIAQLSENKYKVWRET